MSEELDTDRKYKSLPAIVIREDHQVEVYDALGIVSVGDTEQNIHEKVKLGWETTLEVL